MTGRPETSSRSGQTTARIAPALLRWYDRNGRDLPWRVRAPAQPDPYRVWLSEIMLQQTTTASVAPYFARFIARWPRLADLAAARRADVLAAWAGLGYYARARNLHACARLLMDEHGGRFPDNEAALRALPGIGAYTAAAIASIAFGKRAVVVDANVERVLTRLAALTLPVVQSKRALRRIAESLTPMRRAGDYAQGMMDLGATVCTATRPKCAQCPLARQCLALRDGLAETLPAKSPKLAKPRRRAVAFWLVRADGAVLLRRRPDDGLLGGMMEVPSTPWTARGPDDAAVRRHAPASAVWRALPGEVRHGFTHLELSVRVVVGRLRKGSRVEGDWWPQEKLENAGLPTLMRKIARHAGAPV